jgi:hypothetical protein
MATRRAMMEKARARREELAKKKVASSMGKVDAAKKAATAAVTTSMETVSLE